MRPQLTENLLKYGVLKCRDLVELYYGWRIVTFAVETKYLPGAATLVQILQQDTRRIKYEIILNNESNAGDDIQIGTPDAIAAGTSWDISIAPADSYTINRSFLTDLDAVVQPLWAEGDLGNIACYVRETFLTPSPVDEVPLG